MTDSEIILGLPQYEITAIDRTGPEETSRHCSGPYEFVELVGVTHWIPTQAPQEAAEAILARIGEL